MSSPKACPSLHALRSSRSSTPSHFQVLSRYEDRTIATFDVPNASDTFPVAINEKGQVAGYFAGADSALHGFLREADGNIKTFDVPNSTGTLPAAMNARGEITGVFLDASGDQHGFVFAAK